jgi:hypothetical protein
MFRGVIHVDPVDQVFLDQVATEVGVLLLDVCNGLIEIEPPSIGPDKSALLGVEVHVLHEIAERVGELGKFLAFGRMPPLEEIIKEGIVREDTVPQIVRFRFAPTAHELALLKRSEPLESSRHRVTHIHIAIKAPKRLAGGDFSTESPSEHVLALPIMSTSMVNEL